MITPMKDILSFFIQIDEMTQDVALIVTDFAEDEDEKRRAN